MPSFPISQVPGGGLRHEFFGAVLVELHIDSTFENLVAFVAWAQAEGGTAKFNPLNTTQPAAGATDYNKVGVKHYPSWAAGITATVKTLQNGHYPQILAALKAGGNAAAVAQAVVASPWGTGPNVIALVPAVRADPGKYDTLVAGVGAGGAAATADPGAAQDATPIPGEGLVTGTADALAAVASFVALIAKWATWERILYLLAGAGLVVGGLVLIAGDTKAGRLATKAATAAL